MKIAIATLWATRKSEDSPELLVAWDEFCIDGNWEGWAEACKKALASMGNDLDQHRYFNVVVDFAQIEEAFRMGRVEADKVVPMDGPEAFV